MAYQPLGKIAMTPKGEWNSSDSYQQLDVVTFNGSVYISIQDINPGESAPNMNNEKWQKLLDISEITGNVNTKLAQVNSLIETIDNKQDTLNNTINIIKNLYGAPTTVNTIADMVDTSKVYVYTGTTNNDLTENHWYYYDGSAWVDGGIYTSTTIITDSSLTQSGAPADAKATGDQLALKANQDNVSSLQTTVNTIKTTVENSNTVSVIFTNHRIASINNAATNSNLKTFKLHPQTTLVNNTCTLTFKSSTGTVLKTVNLDFSENPLYYFNDVLYGPQYDQLYYDNNIYYINKTIQTRTFTANAINFPNKTDYPHIFSINMPDNIIDNICYIPKSTYTRTDLTTSNDWKSLNNKTYGVYSGILYIRNDDVSTATSLFDTFTSNTSFTCYYKAPETQLIADITADTTFPKISGNRTIELNSNYTFDSLAYTSTVQYEIQNLKNLIATLESRIETLENSTT